MHQSPYEQYLIDTIVPELEQGRPGWDKPHTLEVVRYVKAIVSAYNASNPTIVDMDSLVVAAYLHDYGYRYFVDYMIDGPTQGTAKAEHARYSAEKWRAIQEHEVFADFTDEQKIRIEHLILVHDQVEQLSEPDELILMEADTLGALSTTSEVDTNSEQYQNYLKRTQAKRMSRFITPYSQQEAARLLTFLLY